MIDYVAQVTKLKTKFDSLAIAGLKPTVINSGNSLVSLMFM